MIESNSHQIIKKKKKKENLVPKKNRIIYKKEISEFKINNSISSKILRYKYPLSSIEKGDGIFSI